MMKSHLMTQTYISVHDWRQSNSFKNAAPSLQAGNCTQLNWYANRQTSEHCCIHPNNARGMTDINKRAEVFVCSKLPDACASNTSCYFLKIRKNVELQSKSTVQGSVIAVQCIKRSLTERFLLVVLSTTIINMPVWPVIVNVKIVSSHEAGYIPHHCRADI